MESQNDTFTCTKCNIEKKPVSDFYKNKNCKRGHLSICKKCHAASKKTPKASNTQQPKDEIPTTKTCSKCKETKPITDFNNSKGTKDGKYSQCRKCHNNYFYERVTVPRLKYLEKFNEDRKKYIQYKEPNDYKIYEDRLGAYNKKYPLPLKYLNVIYYIIKKIN